MNHAHSRLRMNQTEEEKKTTNIRIQIFLLLNSK